MGATKILYSEWAIPGETGAANGIYARVAPKTQGKDRLLVQEITKDAIWDKLLVEDDVFKGLLTYARG